MGEALDGDGEGDAGDAPGVDCRVTTMKTTAPISARASTPATMPRIRVHGLRPGGIGPPGCATPGIGP